MPLFSRKSTEPATVDLSGKEGGKGRPTPSRRERELANKARAKQPTTRKERAAALSAQRQANSALTREAMKTGDDRYLPARDRGPVKRFVRDWVDSHFMVAEIVLPLMIVVLVIGFKASHRIAIVLDAAMLLIILVVAVNSIAVHFALRRELKKRFPDQSRAGTTYYAIMRSLQVRPLRMPRPQVKMGASLPDTYR